MVRKYSLNDEDGGEFGEFGEEEGNLQWPVAITSDSGENVLISDEAAHMISSFDRDGKFLGCFGERGAGQGQLNRPAGLALDDEENIYLGYDLFVAETMDSDLKIRVNAQGEIEGIDANILKQTIEWFNLHPELFSS